MQTRELPPPSNPELLPVLATVVYLAALIALWGFTSLALDVEVVGEADAGPLLGPAMAAAACIVTWVAVRRPPRSLWLRAAAAVASVVVVMLVVGAVGYTVTRGEPVWLLLFVASNAASPFVIGAGVLSGVTVLSISAARGWERH